MKKIIFTILIVLSLTTLALAEVREEIKYDVNGNPTFKMITDSVKTRWYENVNGKWIYYGSEVYIPRTRETLTYNSKGKLLDRVK